ncbi:MAG: hypothetical protein JSW39_11180 [Desulfobacterales bacterium]|nr:MAG: hypothetical protein JSW39_11180 [Desulfobacterales bacterium]
MEDNDDRMFPADYLSGLEFERSSHEPIDDYAIAYVERTFRKTIAELLTYGAELRELVEYVFTPKAVCEFSYELQCCVFDLFPRWYIAQTPFRNEIYPDIQDINWGIWLNHWDQLGAFLEKTAS